MEFFSGCIIPGLQGRRIWEFCAVRESSASLLPLGKVGQLGKPGIIPGAAARAEKGFLDPLLGIYGMFR